MGSGGKELSADNEPRIQGFQLWVALPAKIENSESISRDIESSEMVQVGPAHLIIGQYEGEKSCVPAPEGMNYLLVTLRPGESWTYQPPMGHTVGWLALAKGSLSTGDKIHAGEMVIFESGEKPITLEASGKEDAVFVLGSAVPHPYDLHLGNYSVHTSRQALFMGEGRIRELGIALRNAGDRKTESGTIPVYR